MAQTDVWRSDSLQEVVVTGTGTRHLLKNAPVQTEVITKKHTEAGVYADNSTRYGTHNDLRQHNTLAFAVGKCTSQTNFQLQRNDGWQNTAEEWAEGEEYWKAMDPENEENSWYEFFSHKDYDVNVPVTNNHPLGLLEYSGILNVWIQHTKNADFLEDAYHSMYPEE